MNWRKLKVESNRCVIKEKNSGKGVASKIERERWRQQNRTYFYCAYKQSYVHSRAHERNACNAIRTSERVRFGHCAAALQCTGIDKVARPSREIQNFPLI